MHELEIIRDANEVRFNRDGSTRRVRVVAFFLGKFGPYTEEWPVDEFTDAKFTDRVTQLQTQLRLMGAR